MIAGLGILVATTVVAAIYGPFIVGNYFPGVSYEDDRAVENAYTSNIPRNVMNLNVAKIKYGDIVRMVFPSGDIYDYEVAVAKCSAFSSLSCGTYSKATKVSSPNSRATVGQAAKDAAQDAAELRACSISSNASFFLINVPTGYWSQAVETINNVVTITASYMSTGSYTYTQPHYASACP